MAGSARRLALLAAANFLLLPAAILIFGTGFFPYKPFLPGLATFAPTPLGDRVPAAPFDKLVFMVVDALRSDFVFAPDTGFTFTQSLIADGSAIPFTAHATAPTVTMPRIKAITTGSIPSFLDMILNVAEDDKTSSLAYQDTWLAQMKARENDSLIMYGDDTWLKLFPDTFSRSDGTSSFFVADFTEVDNNVTRHIPEQLSRDDWSVMVLHYLGMDHIGHKAGPRSVNMLPKQREMDGIVKRIYEAMEAEKHLQSTLLVLCGDHGMTDGGNHGGSAPGETSPALVFISSTFRRIPGPRSSPVLATRDYEFYEVVEQSDVAPSLAGLLGFPVPLNNLGVFIPTLLKLWSEDDDGTQILLRNAMQMLDIAKATFPHPGYADDSIAIDCQSAPSTTEELVCAWRCITDEFGHSIENKAFETARQRIIEFCRLAQRSLSSTASNYDLPRMYAGIALVGLATIICAMLVAPQLRLASSSSGRFFVGAAVAYAAMMLASSYVEEEHQFWHWMTSTWLTMQVLSGLAKSNTTSAASAFCALALFRVMRRWAQSGQKHQGAPDIARLLERRPLALLWPLVAIALHAVHLELAGKTFARLGARAARLPAALLALSALVFKLASTLEQSPELLGPLGMLIEDNIPTWVLPRSPAVSARFTFALLAAGLTVAAWSRLLPSSRPPLPLSAILAPLLTLLLIVQARLTTVPALLLCLAMQHFLVAQNRRGGTTPEVVAATAVERALANLLLSHSAFFAMGGTNGIASVDLSNAYNGVSSFRPAVVGLLLVLTNWAGPLFWALGGHAPNPMSSRMTKTVQGVATQDQRPGVKAAARSSGIRLWRQEAELLTLWACVEALAVMAACVMHRQHLFVWTVFSPKYLYMAAWAVCWHLAGNVALAGALAWAG